MRFFVSESFTFSFFFWRLFIFHKLLLWKSGFWSKWWLTVFRFLVSLICGIYQLRYLLFPRQMPDFWKERSVLFAWSGPQFPHLRAWFRRRQCMVAFGTAAGCPLISGVVSLHFSTTIWETSSNSTFCSSCLILAFRKDFLFFVSFCIIMFIWLFWCWWCGCVTLLLSVVGVSLVFPWRGWWHFYIFVVVFALSKCFLMFCIDWI